MTSNDDAGHPRETSDAQLDQFLEAANEELLNHVRETTNRDLSLAAIMGQDAVEHRTQDDAATGSQELEHPGDQASARLDGRSFLNSLSQAERAAFNAVAMEQTFARGARLMSAGSPVTHVMMILSGWTQTIVAGNAGVRVVAEQGPGQLLGERAALRMHTRPATVVALETVRALVMKIEDFARFISAHPGAIDVIERQIYSRLTDDPQGYGHDSRQPPFPIELDDETKRYGPWPWPLAGENCTVLITDVLEFGARYRSDRDRQIIRHESLEMVKAVLGPLWEACIWQDQGDGLLIVFPPHVPTTAIMERVHQELPGTLRSHNQTYSEGARIRLRAAVTVGPVVGDPLGLAGDTIIRAARLVEAPVVKEAMRTTGSELGIVISEFVYDTVRWYAGEYIDPDLYRQVRVISKEFKSLAWMQLIDGESFALR